MSGGLAVGFLQFWNTMWTILFYSWPFVLLVIIFINKMTWKKYPIEAVIIEKRGENLIKTNDRVGKRFDRFSDLTFYKLKKSGDTIPVYNFDWILHNVSVPTNLLERYINLVQGNTGTIFLFRYGSKQYKPINLKQGNGISKKLVQVNGKKGEPIYSYQYIQFDPRTTMGTLDFDVIDWDNINFMVQEQRTSMIRRQKKGEFLKSLVIPAMIIGGAVLVSIFILKFSMDAGRDLRGAAAAVPQQSNDDIMGGSKVGGALSNIITPGE